MNAHKAMIQNEIRDRNHIHAVIDANDHDEAWAGSRVGLVGGKQLVASSKQRLPPPVQDVFNIMTEISVAPSYEDGVITDIFILCGVEELPPD
jgi:hypothetical protein